MSQLKQLDERILIIDGCNGIDVADLSALNEADFRGERFADWPSDIQGNK